MQRILSSKVEELVELAELGKRARVIFHDIANHFTALTMSIGSLEESLSQDSKRLMEYSRRSEQARVQMESFASILRCHVEHETSTTINMRSEINRILASFAGKAQSLGVRIKVKSKQQVLLRGDKSAFIHIISNLISNALDACAATPDRPHKEVCIILSHTSKEVSILVRDNGCGIRTEDIPKVFQRKFTTKVGGEGVGLYAIKTYMERIFGGQVCFKTSDAGTEFALSFPKQNSPNKKGTSGSFFDTREITSKPLLG